MVMSTRHWVVSLGAAALLGAGAIAALAAGAAELDDAAEGPDAAITGAALERASEAALAHVGAGRVTETEVGDEEGFYEVEVTLADGTQIDVHLDEDFQVLGDESDAGEANDD